MSTAVSIAESGAAARETAPGLEVLVPCYNHAPFIEQCLRSIFAQTLAPARLLVIDDGSSDGSPEIIERVLKDCPFPSELIARGNKGLCATLNEGLARTRGDYFAYLGSDDLWLPNRLELGVRRLDAEPEAVVSHSNFLILDADGRVTGDSSDWGDYRDGDVLGLLLRGRNIPQSSTVTYRRSALAGLSWNEQSRLEDYELFLRLAHRGPFAFIIEPLAGWRQHGENTSRNVRMMLSAMLEAQARVAPDIGVSAGELAESQGALRFRHSDYLLMHARRGEAARLAFANFRFAPSVGAALRQIARLAVPLTLLKARERRLAERHKHLAPASRAPGA